MVMTASACAAARHNATMNVAIANQQVAMVIHTSIIASSHLFESPP
jgi:hypothetical protein